MTTTAYVHMLAPNDINGNPRRLFYCITFNTDAPGLIMREAIDEGLEGTAALARAYPNAEYAGAVEIPVSEYKRLLARSAKR